MQVISEANDYSATLATDDDGTLIAKRLPFGVYRVGIQHPGFAPVKQGLEIRSALPARLTIKLGIAAVNAVVLVQGGAALIDTDRAGSSNEIGAGTIQNRPTSLPGRSLQDLVNSQPGWLYEGNAVLHPRGSEYQTQFVVDGMPLTDNRSPSFGPEIEADDVESLDMFTPREFPPNLDARWAA